MHTNFHDLLDSYSDVLVRVGLNVQKGQQVIIVAPIEAIDLVRLVTKKAYQIGASLVTPMYSDPEITRLRYKYAGTETFDTAATWLSDGVTKAFDEGTARLVILGRDPQLLKDANPDCVARVMKAESLANKGFYSLLTKGHSNWCIAAYATEAWAKQVFPGMTAHDAVKNLWAGIFSASRVTKVRKGVLSSDTIMNPDPIEEWRKHNVKLHEKASYMNEKNFDALHFVGPDTDLVVGLASGHKWNGGAKMTKGGFSCNSNIPTEEIFTTPHRDKVDGIVSSTKPLLYSGKWIDGIKIRFEKGKAVEVHANSGEDVLKNLLSQDEHACRLGEVALVPHSSPISASGILYKETLFDENASCHLAFGLSYGTCMFPVEGETPEDLIKRGANKSIIHVDWMIGSDKVSVYGVKDGVETPVLLNGEWA